MSTQRAQREYGILQDRPLKTRGEKKKQKQSNDFLGKGFIHNGHNLNFSQQCQKKKEKKKRKENTDFHSVPPIIAAQLNLLAQG